MIFQDPYSSLNPRKTVGSIIGEPFAIHGLMRGKGERKRAVQELMETRRPEPRALQPLSARVLRRPAPADRRRARARAEAEAADRRRARLGARRLDPGAGAQPAARHAARARADADLHRPRPLRRPPHVRPGRRDVPRQDRRDRPRRCPLRLATPPLHAARCSPRCRSPTRRASAGERPLLSGDVPSPANPPERVPLSHALPEGAGALLGRGAAARGQGNRHAGGLPLPADAEEIAQIGVRSAG